MKIVIEYQGNRYESIENSDTTVEEMSEAIYKNFQDLNKFTMRTKGGGAILLGKEALQGAVILFVP
jgi:hypothetical protein